METTGAERTKGGIELGLSVLQRQLSPSTPLVSPDSFYNPSFHRITDETLACVSTVLEDTMDPSLIANEMGPTANVYDAQMKKTTNEDTVISGCRSQMKTNSLLCIPEENSHAEDFSMSFISSQNNTEELTQTDLKGDPHDPSSPLPESSICNEKCYMRVESNSTFDLVKEGSMGSNSTKALNCKGVETNITFEKSQELKERYSSDPNSTVSTNNDSLQGEREKHLNSIDIYCPSNVTTEQHNEKLDSTVDIIHSSVCKQEQCNEGLTSVEDCEKHGTFTKEVNVSIDVTGVVEKNGIASHVSTELGEPCNVHAPDRAFNKHNTMADLTHPSPLPTLKNSNINTTEDVLKTSNIELPPQSSVDVATTVGDALLSGPSDTISTAAVPTVNVEVAVCCNRTLDLPGAENKGEDQQGHFQRRTGVSDDSKPSNSSMTKPKLSSLLPTGQRRLGLKPPGSASFSVEAGHSQTNSKPSVLTGIRTRSSLLPGFAQKQASSGDLPLAKRKKNDMLEQPTCPEAPVGSKPGDDAQRIIAASKDNRIKGPSTGCENCVLIQERLCMFHQQLGEFLQELRRFPADCEKWLPFQQNFEVCLEEFRRLQAAHQ
ncbi:uncharacterized protein si:ch211-126c2.4 isoform X2 [Electrophorus electricus]|uniref:uncharacterized protein si:ch211-126c2.4 isoform X2 n=1 Tax=Electrophorus electricus TaxID=8005 RepID=UPI000F09D9F6|nr:uncharacterized protein si:ch211-126c2.4 isoform X2 [Electrophorus electricus]